MLWEKLNLTRVYTKPRVRQTLTRLTLTLTFILTLTLTFTLTLTLTLTLACPLSSLCFQTILCESTL
jgi:hypothetical protein